MIIPESVKNELKKPLGKMVSVEELAQLAKGKRIISVGDVCTLNIISANIKPHLAVFDHLYMRNKLEQEKVSALSAAFPNPKKYRNPAGTISDDLIIDAERLVEQGGSILIDGEEDLTALAFLLVADEKYLIVYGQPNEGMVAITPKEEIKKKIEKWLAVAPL